MRHFFSKKVRLVLALALVLAIDCAIDQANNS